MLLTTKPHGMLVRVFAFSLAASMTALGAATAIAEDFSLGLGISGSGDVEGYRNLYTKEQASLLYTNGPFQAFAALVMSSDGKYGASAAGGYLDNAAVVMEESGLRFKNEFFLAEAGRLRPSDIVESPYSLFVSDAPNQSLGARYTLSGEAVSMTTRWLSLVERSGLGYADRGAVLKTYALKLGKLRLAYQDAAVYTANSSSTPNPISTDLRFSNFDAEYFFNPLPGFVIQNLNSLGEQPRRMSQNDNAIMGLYAEWEDENLFSYFQLLVDDINLNRFFAPEQRMLPDKLGLSLGGRLATELGRFGFYTGGATKYSFEAYGLDSYDSQYGYTYVPDVSYSVGGSTRPILLEDNMIGFKLGENALGLKGTWDKEFGSLAAEAGLELTIKGDQSPANPWHGGVSAPFETEFLNDALLETKLIASGGVSWRWVDLRLMLSGKAGYTWNPLGLVAAEDGGKAILRPQAGSALAAALTVSLHYALDLLALMGVK